ncbi:hypothetical protein GCM10011578_057290 [Streptomyces fuscichromogenes]|uniref:Uncharacterized protein n=1 Tax=Streptomyces fuscichromogenes TaxID=1324013 RepID=A0A918CTW2_9ACTN|nr:hypothetical protein GCM10011578_057290 [Streptomyces fuscichromogenes]
MEVRAAVASAGVRMPAARVPDGRDLRCDANGGDSFHVPPTELAVGFGRVVRKGCPTVRSPEGSRDRFTPGSVWVPGSGCAAAPRTRRRPCGPAMFAGGGRTACPAR